jgi:hypothetical protein
MDDQPSGASPAHEGAYVAALWEHPRLCVAFFGAQFHTPEGAQLYGQSGIHEEMMPALAAAGAEGLLHNRLLTSPEGPLIMQYWRSYEDLDRWARKLPHMAWWRWLVEHRGQGVGFYHEIYQVSAAEAIYEAGTLPVGPAAFCPTEDVPSGQGRSKVRQERFAAARGPES